MKPLIDFLNHSILPFTARKGEIERLVSFWRSTVDAQGLRTALLVGEAGVGKTRLLDQALPQITAAGGIVARVRLYPESATSLMPLIAQGVWYAEGARQLLKGEPEGKVEDVVGALRRLARLRPTLVVVEDYHLLEGEARGQFSALLNALSDESLSILCTARPIGIESRAPLEGYLVETILLHGFSQEDLRELWKALFEDECGEEILSLLGSATGGNAFALRSALRGALASGSLVRQESSGHYRTSAESLHQALQQSAEILATGMIAHLSSAEQNAAEQLASLGEVFAPEAAGFVIEQPEGMLNTLRFKGVILPSVAARPPLGRTEGGFPIAFTHTLLHRHLVAQMKPAPDNLLRFLASTVPVYSTLPFQLIADHQGEMHPSEETVQGVFRRVIDVSFALESTPDWGLGRELIRAADTLLENATRKWEPQERELLRQRLLVRKLAALRRNIQSNEFRSVLDQLDKATRSPSTLPQALHRLSALSSLFISENDDEIRRRRLDEADALLERFPDIRTDNEYLRFLRDVAYQSEIRGDFTILDRVEEEFNALLSSENISVEQSVIAKYYIAPFLLLKFANEEELQKRLRMLEELESLPIRDNLRIGSTKLRLFNTIAEHHKVLQLAEGIARQAQQIGFHIPVIHSIKLVHIYARAATGTPLQQALDEARQNIDAAPEMLRSTLRARAGVFLVRVAILSGQTEWASQLIDDFSIKSMLTTETHLLVNSIDVHELARQLPASRTANPPIAELIRFATGAEGIDLDDLHSDVDQLLAPPILAEYDLLTIYATVVLLDLIGESRDISDRIEIGIRHALVHALTWLSERMLPLYMENIIVRFKSHFSTKEQKLWHNRILLLKNKPALVPHPRKILKVTMLGSVTVQQPEGEPQKLGARLRTVLGLLVANRMIREPLLVSEFRQLATGGEQEIELARKTTNMAIARLREALSPEAIITGTEAPRLNLDLVHVDLLEAHTLIDEASSALREHALMRAVPALIQALEITRGEVPFPGLYDDFFEGAREDFESRLRSAVIETARELLRERDGMAAEKVLQHAFEALPEDEEIAELLRETLMLLDRRAEAERIRLRAAQEAET